MNKQEILDYFKDINFMYNSPSRYESLDRMIDEMIVSWLESFNTESATECFTAVQELKKKMEGVI